MIEAERKITELLKTAKRIKPERIVEVILRSNPKTETGERINDMVVGELQETLYKKGEDVDGQKLITDAAASQRPKNKGNVYSWNTIKQKKAKGQRTQNVTLKDTGEMYDSMKVKIDKEGLRIDADFSKDGEYISDNFTGSGDNFKEQVLYITDSAEMAMGDTVKAIFPSELKKILDL